MADISAYVRQIQQAARGEEVRDALVDSLSAINNSISPSVEAALEEAKDSGDFTGPQGPKGDPGDAGVRGETGPYFTPSVSSEGVISWSNNGGLTNPSSVNIRGPRGESGAAGAQGPSGSDGESPAVTITNISGGHRVTITDADHPSGQAFDVMDGAGNGDMTGTVYDSGSVVATAGGIPIYVSNAIANNNATEKTANKVTSMSASSTNTQYPTAKAVWDLFNSIIDGNEVSY